MAQPWRVEEHGVKKNEYTEELIAFAVKQVALGAWSPGACKLTISDAMFYNWAQEVWTGGHMELCRLKHPSGCGETCRSFDNAMLRSRRNFEAFPIAWTRDGT